MARCVLVFVVVCFFVFFLSPKFGMAANEEDGETPIAGRIGVILDDSSPAGNKEKLALHRAAEAFHKSAGCRLALHFRDSGSNPVRAAAAAMKLIKEKEVNALIGLDTWKEAAFIAELSNKAHVPILSLSETSPPWSSVKWPFLIRVARNNAVQVKAIAAIVGSWQWQRVTVIYEDMDFVSSNIIPQLSNALLEVNSVIDYQIALPPSPPSLSEELAKLLVRQCRVFIVYTSFKLAVQLFHEATQMGMMDKGYVWITSNDITSHLDAVNSSIISSMQGIIGVKDSAPPKTSNQFPDINIGANLGQGTLEAKAYDALRAVGLALSQMGQCGPVQEERTQNSTELLEIILASNFQGMSGCFRFDGGILVSSKYFGVVNVVGKSYRELGFWSEESGFMHKIKNGWNVSKSMRVLGQIYWPGGPWYNPRGWAPPTGSKQLVIGVPARSAFPQFVKVNYEAPRGKDKVTGFSIDVFNKVLERLPYELHHEYAEHNGTYDSMVEEVGKKYDIVVGDTSIVADRYQYVQFSQPYAEPGLVMLISAGPEKSNSKAWLFMKPFTLSMWAVTALITLYNGFVVYLIERSHNDDLRGGLWNQAGMWIWLSFTTLFSHHGEEPRSNLSIITMVVWLFVTIILTSSYAANLTSMITYQGLASTTLDIETLKRANDIVGCDHGSFVVNYLVQVLGFNTNNIRQFASGDDYPKALASGEITAAFLRVPFAKVLLAKYCKSVVTAGPIFDVGGFGFAFPKGSPIVPDVSQAILHLSENAILPQLFNKMVSSYNCSISETSEPTGPLSLSLNSFWGLFVITGVTTTVSLVLFVVRFLDIRSRVEAMHQNLQQSFRKNSSSHNQITEMAESNTGLNGTHSSHHLEGSENGEAENSRHSVRSSDGSQS